MNTAQPAQDYSVATDIAQKSPMAFIFFPGDLIATEVKGANPDWSRGGKLEPDSRCLQYNNGYIPQCEITMMRVQYQSVSALMVDPAERKYMTQGYTTSDGRRVGGDGLLRVPIFPEAELGRLTGQGNGLVEMPIKNAAEQYNAQRFLFPNWDRIVLGLEQLPRSIGQLKTHLQSRRTVTSSQFEADVAEAAVRACVQFEAWGMQEINRANAALREAEAKGWAIGYGGQAIACFEQLGVPRQDNVTRDQGQKLDQLGDVLAQLARLQLQQQSQQQPPVVYDKPVISEPAETAYNIGDTVIVAETGEFAKIVAKPFGKLKIQKAVMHPELEGGEYTYTLDGEIVMVEKSAVTPMPVAQQISNS
jgi:hypothetical protein